MAGECNKKCEYIFHMTEGRHSTDCAAYESDPVVKLTDDCETDACQQSCPFCDETFCVHSQPCMAKAINLLERIHDELKANDGRISIELEADIDDAVLNG
jgi:hypothetical protein